MKFLKNIVKGEVKKRKRKLSEEELLLATGTGLAAAASYPASKMLMDQDRRGKDARNKRDRDAQNLEPGNSNSRRARQEGN